MTTDDTDRFRALLADAIDRVRVGRNVKDLLAPGADADVVAERLRSLSEDPVTVLSIAGWAERVDAVVDVGGTQARIVFGVAADGRLTGLDLYRRPDRFDGFDGGHVLVCNGPSGAGKSTLMQALQAEAPFPLVVLDEPEHIGTVQVGYLIWRDRAPALHRGYLAAIASLARAGNVVAVSAAGHPYEEVVGVFAGTPVTTVGLRCSLDVLRRREQRPGRWAGIAEASLGVHDGWRYDVELDTSDDPDPTASARLLLGRVSPVR